MLDPPTPLLGLLPARPSSVSSPHGGEVGKCAPRFLLLCPPCAPPPCQPEALRGAGGVPLRLSTCECQPQPRPSVRVESPHCIKVTLYFVDIFNNAKFLREFCGSVYDHCYGFWVQMIRKAN